MSRVTRKHETLNLVLLFTDWTDARWASFLTKKIRSRDFNGLLQARWGLQAGMNDLAKNKLNLDKWVMKYIRWNKSLEVALRSLYRSRYPNPLDRPGTILDPSTHEKALNAKRNRDRTFESILKGQSF
jgi:hypothetical protein